MKLILLLILSSFTLMANSQNDRFDSKVKYEYIIQVEAFRNPNANVNNNVKKVNEKRNIMPGAYHQFLLATLDRDAAPSNIKKIHHADDIDNNSKKVKTSSNTTCYVTLLRKLKKAQFVDTCHLIHNFLDNSFIFFSKIVSSLVFAICCWVSSSTNVLS